MMLDIFYMLIGHLDMFFGEMFILILCPFKKLDAIIFISLYVAFEILSPFFVYVCFF